MTLVTSTDGATQVCDFAPPRSDCTEVDPVIQGSIFTNEDASIITGQNDDNSGIRVWYRFLDMVTDLEPPPEHRWFGAAIQPCPQKVCPR